MKKKRLYLIYFLIIVLCSCVIYALNPFNIVHNEPSIDQKQVKTKKEPTTKKDILEGSKQEVPFHQETSEIVFGVPIEKKVQLNIAQSIQENNYFCVPACLQMVLRYYGIHVEQNQLADEMNTHPISGTEYVDLATIVNTYLFHKKLALDNESGYHIQTLSIGDKNPQIATDFQRRVKENINTNYPLFVAVDMQRLYPELRSANHMIIIHGYATYKDSDKIAFYYAIDPYSLVQDPIYGGYKMFTEDELIHAIISNEEPAYLW